jgi:hypothetical protein
MSDPNDPTQVYTIGIQGPQGPAGTPASTAIGVVSPSWSDANSLVLGDLASPDWTRVTPSASFGVQSNGGTDANGLGKAWLLNPTATATAYGYLSLYALAPPGATSLTYSQPLNLAIGQSMALEVWTLAAALVGRTIAVGNGQWTTYQFSWNVTAGTTYEVRLVCNETAITTAQATGLAMPASVTAAGATGFFASPYTRIHCPANVFLDNAQPFSDATAFGYRHSGYARLVFAYTGSSFAVEFSSTLWTTYPGVAQLIVKVAQGSAGKPTLFTTLPAGVSGALVYATVSGLPSASTNTVEVVEGSTYLPESAMLGTFVRSLYVSGGTYAELKRKY